MSANPADAPNWTPPKWLNSLMKWMLETPVLQRIVGKTTLLIRYTGRKSGRSYVLPLSYLDLEESVLVAGHRSRHWWRNLQANPAVRVRRAGKDYSGLASVMANPDDALADYVTYLEAQPMVARIAGVPLDAEGKADVDKAREVLDYTVVVRVKLEGLGE